MLIVYLANVQYISKLTKSETTVATPYLHICIS